MKKKLLDNFIDSSQSVMPIALVVTILSLVINISNELVFSFAISSILLIIGITFFTTGVDIGLIKIGDSIATRVLKTRKKWLILLVSLIIGFVITIAEPDLIVLASELPAIPNYLIIGLVALGIGIFLMIGVLRIINRLSFRKIITCSLILIMFLLYFTKEEFISVAFDSGGVTTGPIGVPLLFAFGYGITRIRSDKDVQSDTFGLCGLCSLGPVIIILILGLFFKTNSTFDTSNFISNVPFFNRFMNSFIISLKEVIIALLPILLIFTFSCFLGNKLSKNEYIRIAIGVVLTLIGLTLFLTGVRASFLEMGYLLGSTISLSHKYLLIPVGMIIGFIIINAEPAIKILNKKISKLTEGSIRESVINLCMSIGVCFAIGLSLIRIVFDIPIIYIIVPGYFLAAVLMYFTSDIFVTVAYDSGGAACGALTTSFLLPLCIGASVSLNKNIMAQAFGVGSLVALTPIITIQILGIIYSFKMNKKKKMVHLNEEIVEY